MSCKQCPYIEAEYFHKIDHVFDGYEDDIEKCCWCDKVGGKLSLYGYCSDAFTINCQVINHTKKKHRNKREREQKYKAHLKFIADHVQYYPCGVEYVDEKWVKEVGYIPLEKPYYKRIYRDNHSGNSKYWKHYSNRRIRRYKAKIANGGFYKKIFDYWWTMY